MRASIRHCFDMTRLLSFFTISNGDTLFCLSLLLSCSLQQVLCFSRAVLLLVRGSRAVQAVKQGSEKITQLSWASQYMLASSTISRIVVPINRSSCVV